MDRGVILLEEEAKKIEPGYSYVTKLRKLGVKTEHIVWWWSLTDEEQQKMITDDDIGLLAAVKTLNDKGLSEDEAIEQAKTLFPFFGSYFEIEEPVEYLPNELRIVKASPLKAIKISRYFKKNKCKNMNDAILEMLKKGKL